MAGISLVTGATGFAGSHLIDWLVQSHREVAAWTRSAEPRVMGPSRVRWQTVDVVDRRAVAAAIGELRPSAIYHCAGLPHVAESWSRAGQALAVNALGTHHLLDAVQEVVPDCRVVVVGSALVYRWSDRPLREDSPLGPTDPYGVSKLAQEMLALRANTPVVLARPFNHAGPRQQAAFVTASFAKQIAEIEAGAREPRLLVGNLDARRDMTDVRDTVRAYERLAGSGRPGHAYNVCSGVAHRVGDLLEQLLDLARVRITVAHDPARMRPSDNPVVMGDRSRIETETGWRPEIPIRQTLSDLLEWWRAQVVRRAS